MSNRIDCQDSFPSSLTQEDLVILCMTGRAVLVSGSGKNKVFTYRTGVLTRIGDIEYSLWKQAATEFVFNQRGQKLLSCLLEYVDQYPWLKSADEKERAALSLYMNKSHITALMSGNEIFEDRMS